MEKFNKGNPIEVVEAKESPQEPQEQDNLNLQKRFEGKLAGGREGEGFVEIYDEKDKKEKKRNGDIYRKNTPNIFAATALATMLANAPQAEGNTQYEQETKNSVIPDSVKIEDVSVYSPTYERFYSMIESGKYDLKEAIGALAYLVINPIDVGGTMRVEHSPEYDFNVPYEYSRLFNTGKMRNPSDAKKIQEYIKDQIIDSLNPAILDLALSAEDYNREYPGGVRRNTLKITSLGVKGSASPEGRAVSGKQINETDTENLSLARLRAEDTKRATFAVLKELGFTEDFAKNVKWGEQRLSDDEMRVLEALAEKSGTESIELIKAYNRGEVSNSASAAVLGNILNEKRRTTVAIQGLEGKNYIATLPLSPLFLIPFLWRRRRGYENKGLTTEPSSKERTSNLELKTPEHRRPAEVLKQPLNQPVEILSRRTIADIGVDISLYENIVRELYGKKDGIVDDEPDSIDVVSSRVLKSWQDHDNEIRARLGLPLSPIEAYKENPEATVYAYLHAAALRRIASEITSESPDIEETWNDWFKNKNGVRYSAQIDIENLVTDARKLYLENKENLKGR